MIIAEEQSPYQKFINKYIQTKVTDWSDSFTYSTHRILFHKTFKWLMKIYEIFVVQSVIFSAAVSVRPTHDNC